MTPYPRLGPHKAVQHGKQHMQVLSPTGRKSVALSQFAEKTGANLGKSYAFLLHHPQSQLHRLRSLQRWVMIHATRPYALSPPAAVPPVFQRFQHRGHAQAVVKTRGFPHPLLCGPGPCGRGTLHQRKKGKETGRGMSNAHACRLTIISMIVWWNRGGFSQNLRSHMRAFLACRGARTQVA